MSGQTMEERGYLLLLGLARLPIEVNVPIH